MSELNSQIDLYDTEITEVGRVLAVLNSRRAQRRDLETFRKEIIDRFATAGFKVTTRVYTTNVEDVYAFDIDIVDRVTPIEFDHDRQAAEIRADVLGLGTEGTIKTSDIEVQHGHKH